MDTCVRNLGRVQMAVSEIMRRDRDRFVCERRDVAGLAGDTSQRDLQASGLGSAAGKGPMLNETRGGMNEAQFQARYRAFHRVRLQMEAKNLEERTSVPEGERKR